MAQVDLIELTKQFRATVGGQSGQPAVDRLSLSIPSGELTAILGPSGCGKTTTLRMVAGLLAPSGGDIRFDGRSVRHVPAEKRGAVMVFQKHLLFPHLSAGENVAFGLRMRGVDRATMRRRVGDLLELVQLRGFEDRRGHELSGGQQQRVALARALVVEPAVLLLDEPLANLDANLRLEMRRLIRTVQQELGMTTLLVTHDQEEAIMLADRVALMTEGRLRQVGTPRELYEEPVSPLVARFFRNENVLRGVKRGEQVETCAGTLATACWDAAALPDGPVLITVRPEHVRVVDERDACCNRVAATVLGDVYLGSHVQLQVQVGEQVWTLHAPADVALPEGSACCLHLPPARVWVMPDAAG